MSQENLEAIRRVFESYNAGDLTPLHELYDPNVVMFHLEGWPEPGPSVGRDAAIRGIEGFRAAWKAGDSLEVVELIEASNHVLARCVGYASGRGPDATMQFTLVFTFRRGKVITIQYFWAHAEALEAVGLRE